ncbi:MAG: RNA polymerase sigma factor [Novosphingobium sp.]|jgi:RNA polymerase sigma-70 factor (ECF subfamily)
MPAPSLEQTYLAHRPELERFLRARCGDADNTQDLMQDLWLKLSRADEARIIDPLPYLYRMANNLVLDRHRSAQQRGQREGAWQQVSHGLPDATYTDPSAERVAEARQQLDLAEQSLRDLGDRTYRIIRRFRIDEIGQRQIAEEEGISVSAVEKHLQKAYRAVIALRAQLDAEWSEPERLVMVKGDHGKQV